MLARKEYAGFELPGASGLHSGRHGANWRMATLKRAAAAVARGRTVAEGVVAMVVPGSGLGKDQAESEGLDEIFRAAGFDWREPGCSMCLAMNPDKLQPGERCASTSNRNFEGRQGRGGRTHLMSPAMAAAAAIAGRLVDVTQPSALEGLRDAAV